MSAASEINRARLARDMGYNVAGFVEEIYVGAEILIPDTMFGWVDEYGTDTNGESAARYNKQFIDGTVIEIKPVVLQYGDEGRELSDIYAEDGDYLGSVAVATTLKTSPHFVVHFIMLTPDGLQIHKTYGKGWDVFFRIPTE